MLFEGLWTPFGPDSPKFTMLEFGSRAVPGMSVTGTKRRRVRQNGSNPPNVLSGARGVAVPTNVMAELDPITASLVRELPLRTLTALSAPGATPTGRFVRPGSSLDASARANAADQQPISLDVKSARTALAAAIDDAQTIVDTLARLQDAVAAARTSSLVGPTVQLAVGGTRVSRLNIQAEARRAFADINALVASAERGGVNLIASDARPIEVQTTRFGGSIAIAPQPFDSSGLGLGAPGLDGRVLGFRAITDTEIAEAEGTLAQARELASRRLQTLQAIEERLDFTSATGQAVRTLDLRARTTLLARGSVVDLIA